MYKKRNGEIMKTILQYSWILCMVLSASSGCSSETVPPAPEPLPVEQGPFGGEGVSQGNNRFAMELYGMACQADQTSNIFFSPLSISSALAMTYAGARGQTAEEMNDVLHFGTEPGDIGEEFAVLLGSMSSGTLQGADSGEPFTLSIANGLWVADGFALLPSYVQEMQSRFDAAVENLDFIGAPEASRETINGWIADKTLDRITNLIPSGMLDQETRVVLTNAVYFKASWDKPFEEAVTSDGRFMLADGSATVVPMMTQTEFFDYVSTEGCSAVELPYAGGGASMLILLPDGDIESFQQDLDTGKLTTIRSRMSRVNILLTMPRFEFTRSMQLGQILREMGMEMPFQGSADFSGITGQPNLYISEVMHKAFVKVDEEGTEAAAATAVIMNITAMPPPPVEMTVNRPFIFLIIDEQTGSIVFMGRVMDPSV